MIASFIIVLVLLTLSGALAWVRKRKTPEDYLVASRNVPPWLAALSTVATNNSGFMFIGMIGYTYRFGVSSIWLMVGWIIGDLLTWSFVHPHVRSESGKIEVNTLTALIGTRSGTASRPIIIAGSLVTALFLGVYAAAQLKAGSTALHALFGWEMYVGVLIGSGIVVLYSFAGGIRADIWTDAAQSFAMMLAMAMILIAGAYEIGGPRPLIENLGNQDAALTAWAPADLRFGLGAFILGYLFAGLGTIGQPHLMTRLLSIASPESVKPARLWYFAYYIPFFLASIGVGLYCRAIIPDLANMEIAQQAREPTELALPLLTMQLLPEFVVGIALAGLFAATISTADSQVIVCSGSITQEMNPRWQDSYLASKLATLAITVIAATLAVAAPEGVFVLVLIAWSGLGACLGPLVVIRVWNLPMSTPVALLMMASALVAVSVWQSTDYNDDLLSIVPGTAVAALIYGGSLMLPRIADAIRGGHST